MSVKLDHVAFGTRDRDETARVLESLGFAFAFSRCEWTIAGMRHSADAVSCVFASEYLDFIEIADEGWKQRLASSQLHRRGSAPTAVVLSGLRPDRVHAESRSVGSSAPEPYAITRRLAGDGAAVACYEFLALPRSAQPFALVADASPDLLRRPEWTAHPNGAFGIAAVHLRVPSVSEAMASLSRPPLGLDPSRERGPKIALGSTRICFHEQPRSDYLAAVSELLPNLDRATPLALELSVRSVARAAESLREHGVRFEERAAALCVAPDESLGTGVIFV